jgi:hypothetical protein
VRKPSPAIVVATVALFVALGGVGIAANGQSLILGKSDNSATLKTGLSAQVNDKALQLTNTNTGASATALGLTVASGHAPLTVSSQTRVANLNADKLDGIDSAGFVQGRGTALANRIVVVPTDAKTLLTIPGLGSLLAVCVLNVDGWVQWNNDTSSPIDFWQDTYNSHFDAGVSQPNNAVSFVSTGRGATLALGVGTDPGARRTALLHVFASQEAVDGPCTFQAQGTLWTS